MYTCLQKVRICKLGFPTGEGGDLVRIPVWEGKNQHPGGAQPKACPTLPASKFGVCFPSHQKGCCSLLRGNMGTLGQEPFGVLEQLCLCVLGPLDR